MEKDKANLGKPEIKIAGLQIWIHGRQFPDLDDYWDGNWLNVTAHCESNHAGVWVSGNLIHLSEIDHLKTSATKLYKELKGKAALPCLEPELSVEFKACGLGKIDMIVNITPDPRYQKHKFLFEIDQSYLPALISSCNTILKAYQIKGKP